MREIKFRGLSAKGEMVYGSLSPDLPGSTMYYDEYSQRICWFPETGGQANAPVKNGTVGQYIGLKDKNGVELYEGDVYMEDGDTHVCEFDFAMYQIVNSFLIDGDFEIIGNIHQNPELLS